MVEGLTASVEGIDKLLTEAGLLLPALLRLMGSDKDVSCAALTSLVNLSQAGLPFMSLTGLRCLGPTGGSSVVACQHMR